MFTRHGGVSSFPYNTLNLSYGVGDDQQAVAHNRSLLKHTLGITRLVSARQVHGTGVRVITAAAAEDIEVADCDALITALPGVGLMIQQADCQGILLHDPGRRVVAAIHAGWRGSVANIIAETIAVLSGRFQSDPHDLRAIVSPSLGPCCAEFVNHRQELPPSFSPCQVRPNHFDFWRLSREQLVAAGLTSQRIEATEQCTRCGKDFFSYRRARQQGRAETGRQASVIALRA
ncbi:MAG: copper oxidase [Desulfobulbaceae bacterium A2]|nr:MAG: copper oxidase [Desulfobulbaceae bacterium A2]